MKLNLVIDASGIFYRSLYTVGNYGGKKGEKLLDSKASQGVFVRKLATDFSALVRSIDDSCRVIVCLDSTSWRNSVEIDDGGYKSSRKEKKEEDSKKEDNPVNWNSFFELINKFASVLSQKGYIVSQVPGAEGDDLLFFWSDKLNNMEENVILVTGDRDLLQVVKKHDNGSWTVAIDPVLSRNKLSLTQDTLDFKMKESASPDIFNPSSWTSSDDILEKLMKTYEVNVVDTSKLCTMKVVLGDNGDSVPSVVTWKDKKEPEKIRTMTESNYSKIVAVAPSIENATWKDLQQGKFVEEISSTMETLKKISVDRETVRKNLNRNCKLVILSTETIPKQIQDSFKTIHASVPDTIAISSRDSMLNGTEWWTSDKTAFVPKSYDLFGE